MNAKAFLLLAALLAAILVLFGCSPPESETFRVAQVAQGEYDPEKWGQVYPLHYESWLATREPKPAGTSRYKRGWDDDEIIYDKLSQFPFLGLLYNGWGFGIEYNEPRGHYYAVKDQIHSDPSRVAPGGVCLGCKSPFHRELTETHGLDYLQMQFHDAVALIPEKLQELGPACIDCHQPNPMALRTTKAHFGEGLLMIAKREPSRQELRMLACAQCHVTYYVPRDAQMKVIADIALPWRYGTWGDISIEAIIKDLLSDESRLEWTQTVTGFKMPFIRHPEFELFSKRGVHFDAGVACADCHMPFTRVGGYKISDHDVTSPLKAELRACAQCHTQSRDWLRGRVMHTQDRTMSLIIRAGYATATCAKLFETLHAAQAQGATVQETVYNEAKDHYTQAFLRLVFMSAENSTGFHNPAEAGRMLGDAIAFAGKSEALLRQLLAGAGLDPGTKVFLELSEYLNDRGERSLDFIPDQEFTDPFDNQMYFLSNEAKGL